jgi:Mpv17 / PMP22 family
MLISAQEKCIGSLGPVVMANWRVWPVINYINFRLIPRSLRVLFMNVASVAWNAFFCTVMAS